MSAHRRTWALSLNAWNELTDVLNYSEKTWSPEQRNAYRQLFNHTLEILAQSPQIGRIRNEIDPGLRSHPVGSHIIYFWTSETEIEVAHILHARQDPKDKDWDAPVE